MGLDTLETPFGREEGVLGGAASYFSLAARLYTDVRMVAVVGEDFPQEHIHLLESKGVDLAGLQRRPGRTFRWSGRYDYDLAVAHTLETCLNVFADFRPELPEHYRDTEYVFLANIDPELQLAVLEQTRCPRFTTLDSMNYWIEGKREVLERALRRVDAVLLNDSEARMYTGQHNLIAAARQLLKLGPTAVALKKGEHGALLVCDGGVFPTPAFPLEDVKDPTGAGDSFAGGFMGYLAMTGDLSLPNIRRALVHGAVVASFTVEEFGVTRLAQLTPEEVEQRYRQFVLLTHFETES